MAMKIKYPKIETLADLRRAGLAFPASVRWGNVTYWATEKVGTHRATGRATAEYALGGERLWAFSDGSVAEAHS